MLFLAFVLTFVFGLVIGTGIRSRNGSGNLSHNRNQYSTYSDQVIDCREFIGVPLSSASQKLQREFEISTHLTAEFMRNRNMREAIRINTQRQKLQSEHYSRFPL
jgi:hypothetical protein